MPTYAIDFESTYQKGVRDISTLGVYPYLRHAETNIYLVSIVGDDGLEFVGHPIDAPWETISGQHWLSHNAAFDRACLDVCIERGIVPPTIEPSEWDCTANMAAYFSIGRSLAKAVVAILEKPVDKTVRDQMNGKTWESMTPEFRAAAKAYALQDSRLCLELWQAVGADWPEWQKELSRHTLKMTRRGICIDRSRVEEGIRKLKTALWEAQQKIPWAGTLDEKGKEIGITSTKAMRKACEAAGIPMPATTNAKSDAFDLWASQYSEKAPFVAAIQEYRSIKRTLNVLEKMETMAGENGRMPYSLKYFGGHTGRFSGDSGWNGQNLPKKQIQGVDLRACLVPAPGRKFIVADLAQIEARVALWVAGDKRQLDLVRQGMCLYEVHARATMGYKEPIPFKEWVKKEGCPFPKMRDLAKCRRLGLQFGLGYMKFIQIAKEWAKLVLTPAESKAQVNDFRNKEWRVVEMWKTLENAMKAHAGRPEPFTIELPSGRNLWYFDVRLGSNAMTHKPELLAKDEFGSHELHFYGGKLFENCVAGDAEVLVESRGWIPLHTLQNHDKVWDGDAFVEHDGLASRGTRETLSVFGLRATPDHNFLTPSGWEEISTLEQVYAYSCESTRETVWLVVGNGVPRIERDSPSLEGEMRVRNRDRENEQGYGPADVLRAQMSAQQPAFQARSEQTLRVRGLELDAAEVSRRNPSGVPKLRSSWNRGLRSVGRVLRGFLGGHGSDLGEGFGSGQDRQQSGVRARELSVDDQTGKLPQSPELSPSLGSGRRQSERNRKIYAPLSSQARRPSGPSVLREPGRNEEVFDVINCGPRRRFAVRAPGADHYLIAHNCVQAIAADVLAEAVLRIEAAGYPVVLHVHDEVVCEVPLDTPVDAISDLLTTPPEWAEGLPIGCEAHECEFYTKE